MSRTSLWLIAGSVFLLVPLLTPAAEVLGQEPEALMAEEVRATDGEQADGDQADLEQAGDGGVTLTVGPAGSRRHVPGRWATLSVNGLNRTDRDAVETATVMIGDNSKQQYARKLWIPAGATRQSWLAVQIPRELNQNLPTVRMRSIHLQDSEGGEQFRANVIGMPTSERSLLVSHEESRTAAMLRSVNTGQESSEQLQAFEKRQELMRTVYAGRDFAITGGQELGIVELSTMLLPPSAKALDPLDQIVIAGDQILSDTVAVNRLRSWLHGGGRLWVMVDHVPPKSVRALLGDACCFSVVDRVELNDFELTQVIAQGGLYGVGTNQWSSENPVDFVRVMAESDEVAFEIDGWPAAFWKQVGQGEVLFTTLGARGWMNGETPSPALKVLSSQFFPRRIQTPRYTQTLEPSLNAEIGYRIPSRASVAGVLGLHVLMVLAAGFWLARRQSLQWLAVVVPVTAFIAAGSLVAIGNQQTSAVPTMIATGQIARAIPATSQLEVNSVSSIYSQQARDLNLRMSPDATTRFVDAEVSDEMRRLFWDDSGQSKWLFVRQPPGVVRSVVSEATLSLPKPWAFRGRFTPRGLEARIDGIESANCQDGVVVSTGSPALSVDFQSASAGFVTSGYDDVLSPDEFVDAGLMSDVQQDRQRVLRQLMSSERPLVTRQPTLLFWTDPIAAGLTFEDDFVRRGSALVAVPVELERPPSGVEFRVPASFVRLENNLGARGASMVFNAQTGRWLEVNRPNETELRCVPPRELLPCELTRATVLIKINAPSRTLRLKGHIDGQFVTLHERENPNGLLRFEIDRPEALQLDPSGGLLLAVEITPTEEEEERAAEEARMQAEEDAQADQSGRRPQELPASPSRDTWQIDYIHTHLQGKSL